MSSKPNISKSNNDDLDAIELMIRHLKPQLQQITEAIHVAVALNSDDPSSDGYRCMTHMMKILQRVVGNVKASSQKVIDLYIETGNKNQRIEDSLADIDVMARSLEETWLTLGRKIREFEDV